jgi:hypothetical protein
MSVFWAIASLALVAPAADTHWAFQPVRRPPLPEVKHREWAASDIDLFVLSKLEEAGIPPPARADRRALIRRASFDLLGLPPTFEETSAFEADDSPGAFSRLVDRLLSSPRYGERWGRHWLDVARYADTKGYVFEEERLFPFSYTYRDYVIAAFNRDLPYDRFIIEQIAADQLPLGEDRKPLAAMGFLTLGRRFLNNLPDIIDDRIDVVTRGIMGFTVTCARCHDHKFDPIPTRDYYSLYGVFASSVEPKELPLIGAPVESEGFRAYQKELETREAAVAALIAAKRVELEAGFRARVAEYLVAAAVRKEPAPARTERPVQLAAGELNPLEVDRWRGYLEETKKSHHPVFGPWHALSGLKEEEFAGKAALILAGLASRSEPDRPVNPLVVRALTERPPAAFREVAERYGELLSGAERLWRETLDAHQKKPAVDGNAAPPAPTALEDPHQEALRQVLYAKEGPISPPDGELERFFDRAVKGQIRDLRKKVDHWKATSPAAPPRAMVLTDLPQPQNPHVFIRGNPQNQGPEVPRQFLTALGGENRKPFEKGSGRLELAQAIVSRENPLTARVMANRVWLHHFGAGLVRTPSDFGLRSERPVHRELLDFLAWRFMEEGWSVKALHRLIMLSSVYQASSEAGPEALRADPDNRLLSRRDRQRLDFEELRDSLLAVSGLLDPAAGGPPVDITGASPSHRRTVYGFIDRQNLPGLFRTFDFASPDASCPQRFTTTVPQQALFMMNSPFVAEAARALAARMESSPASGARERIAALHRLVYGRQATEDEIELGLKFLEIEREPAGEAGKGQDAAKRLNSWGRYAQVLLDSNEFAFID